MVEQSITDGRRIAELLASELTGLAVGPLAHVSVVDAVPDVEPSEAGTDAFAIEFAGERIGAVRVRPSGAVLALHGEWDPRTEPDHPGLATEDGDLVIGRGAAVKAAVDRLGRRLRQEEGP